MFRKKPFEDAMNFSALSRTAVLKISVGDGQTACQAAHHRRRAYLNYCTSRGRRRSAFENAATGKSWRNGETI
jgi:hypothetical protein